IAEKLIQRFLVRFSLYGREVHRTVEFLAEAHDESLIGLAKALAGNESPIGSCLRFVKGGMQNLPSAVPKTLFTRSSQDRNPGETLLWPVEIHQGPKRSISVRRPASLRFGADAHSSPTAAARFMVGNGLCWDKARAARTSVGNGR
ncbi:MAG: hypothetical protein LAQ30_08205, partial [Acidobacteriia bacterium]|nr:hypothetical protein [Terriglobia bacterium]